MQIIEIAPLENGAHRNQTLSGTMQVPEGWAIIPASMTIPTSFPFVDVETDGDMVTGLTAREIPAEVPDIEEVRAAKISEMSAACAQAITAGVDVTLSDGTTGHYSLTLEDQLNLMNLQAMVVAGMESVPYHADGEQCRYYSAADFTTIVETATAWKLYQESYFNSLRDYINSMAAVEDIQAVTYGMDIPRQYQTQVLQDLMAEGEV